MEVVVARYNESLDWVAATVPPACLVTVYNKGDPLAGGVPGRPADFGGGCDVATLPNVGREAHTYLHHIVTHYDDLDDHTIFLQGHPFDHCPDLANQLRQLPQPTPMTDDFRYFANWMLSNDCTARECPGWPWVPMWQTYEAVFGQPAPDVPLHFGAGAQFAVSRAAIRRRPLAFYRNALDVLTTMDRAAWAIERMWPLVFTAAAAS
jgi:hypothetical protein